MECSRNSRLGFFTVTTCRCTDNDTRLLGGSDDKYVSWCDAWQAFLVKWMSVAFCYSMNFESGIIAGGSNPTHGNPFYTRLLKRRRPRAALYERGLPTWQYY